MHRLFLTSTATALAFFALAPPVWAAWVWPLSGEVITRYSNGSDPYAGGQHRGIDIAGETGQPVVAAAGGSVRFAGTAGSSGLTVSIRTTDGFDTSYLHLSSASVLARARRWQRASGSARSEPRAPDRRSARTCTSEFARPAAGTPIAIRSPSSLLRHRRRRVPVKPRLHSRRRHPMPRCPSRPRQRSRPANDCRRAAARSPGAYPPGPRRPLRTPGGKGRGLLDRHPFRRPRLPPRRGRASNPTRHPRQSKIPSALRAAPQTPAWPTSAGRVHP